jgi:hypothetical protein
MKKVFFAIGIISCLLIGAVTVQSVFAGNLNTKVCDDPPKKDAKSQKSCCPTREMSNCKTPCTDKKEVKEASIKETKATSTTTEATATKKETEKVDPDKK